MRSKIQKVLCVFLALNILIEAISPFSLYALTSGPKSPDFSGFTPATTTDMVDLTSGDFNYNLPVLEVPGSNGGGYPLSLSYSSNVNSEQEASWVGFGWTLNPGNIERNLRGYPDDYEGQTVDFYNKTRPSWSVSKTIATGLEILSSDGDIGLSATGRFNNYNGYYYSKTVSVSAFGLGLSVNYDDKGVTFSPQINVLKMIGSITRRIKEATSDKKEEEKKANKTEKPSLEAKMMGRFYSSIGSYPFNAVFGLYTFGQSTQSVTVEQKNGWSENYGISGQINPSAADIGVFIGLNGNFNVSYNEPSSQKKVYGYFNSSKRDVNKEKESLMDYYMEKESPFSKRDVFIGIPFANYDVFSVTGEGIGGGFRAYPDEVQDFTPPKITSRIKNYNIGVEIGAGEFMSGGVDVGAGSQVTSYENWGDYRRASNKEMNFRFNNDLGGEIEYAKDNKSTKGIVHAALEVIGGIPGFSSATLNEDPVVSLKLLKNQENKGKRSSVIEPIQNRGTDFGLTPSNIRGFKITNTAGDIYEYNVPVCVKNETEMTFDIDKSKDVVRNNYIAYRSTPLSNNSGKYSVKVEDSKAAVGQIKTDAYATSYLLSQIKKTNYVDVNLNGVTDEGDFGGWTKFNYRKIFGSNSENRKYYRYRNPYKGLFYSRNSISDKTDDVGSVTTGEKELYNIETIETDTHIAFFVTNKYKPKADLKYAVPLGSGSDRKDCKSAISNFGQNDILSNDRTNSVPEDVDAPEYLEKIVLFSKENPTKPIKTVCFQYSNDLVKGLPNCEKNQGKLTLVRIWFEYGGVNSAKISPYEFKYEYKKSNEITDNKYKSYFEEYDEFSKNVQNPSYAPELLDTWGCICPYGAQRKNKQIPWHYQGVNPTWSSDQADSWRADVQKVAYDPAAWHLKSIKLPSGGEILIQYEEKDYRSVQDRPVMGMASLLSANNEGDTPTYLVNVDDLGCDPLNEKEVTELNEMINGYFENVNSKELELKGAHKVYFKFLFALLGSNPDLESKNSEYITGYSSFSGAKVIESPNGKGFGIEIKLGKTSSSSGGRTVTPKQGAIDFYTNTRKGLIGSSVLAPNYADMFDNAVEKSIYGGYSKALGIGIFMVYSASSSIVGDIQSIIGGTCNKISPSLSYLKLPLYRAKKGGGVRVKRLMLYDSGLATGQESLYGSAYHYVLEDGVTSSGVATNEPGGNREENPLVSYIVRKDQSMFSRLTVGEDVEQTEGPIGESLLPGASITYSRVVTENIYASDEKSNKTGFSVNEFYTTYDYPFDYEYAPVNKPNLDDPTKTENVQDEEGSGVEMSDLKSSFMSMPAIPLPVISISQEDVAMEQGFRFMLNSMNGKPKSVSVYGGRYGNGKPSDQLLVVGSDLENGYLVSKKTMSYYQPGEMVRMLFPNGTNGEYTQKYSLPGKEVEFVVAKKKITDNTNDFNVEFDLGVILPFIPGISALPSIKMNSSVVSTHATSKILRYPTILKSETNYVDGITTKVEYLAFNSVTGSPMIVKSYDIYGTMIGDKKTKSNPNELYHFSLPASWVYPEMGRKENDNQNTNQLTENVLDLVTYNNAPLSNWFQSGNTTGIKGVLKADVTTFAKGWENSWNDQSILSDNEINTRVTSPLVSLISVINNALNISNSQVIEASNEQKVSLKSSLSRIWRLKSVYKYSTQDLAQVGSNLSVDEPGTYIINTMFNWGDNSDNSKWMKLSEVTKYSPHGNPLEEIDYMGISSSVNYNRVGLPSIIAQNSKYGEMYFTDYESDVSADSRNAHSGIKSMKLESNGVLVDNILASSHLAKNGAVLKFWAISQDAFIDLTISSGAAIKASRVSSSGKWSLYSCDIAGGKFQTASSITLNTPKALFVDDVLLKPSDSKTTCYVYDNMKRLTTQFDDQHFGLFYVYNDEGQLTHKKVETERGMKTVQETMYNTPRVNR